MQPLARRCPYHAQLLALGALIAGSFWILRPFLVALTWATIIVVATWPLLLHAQAWLWGSVPSRLPR